MDARIGLMCMKLVPGLGDRANKLLIDAFGSAAAVLAASDEELKERAGCSDKLIGLLRNGVDRDTARRRLDEARGSGYRLLFYGEPGYPEQLAAIHDPPALLYIKGELNGPERCTVAMVGSRKATTHALDVARRVAAELAAENVCVVSGLAYGVDTAAHKGALEGNGRTIAVLGSGLDRLYPKRNMALARDIVANGGAVITEHLPETGPVGHHFPKRNRIISGLSQGVVVVEAAKKSGSLITAAVALEQGREVFAVPGMARSPSAEGANNLLRQGAVLAESAEDVLDGLGLAPIKAEVAEGLEGVNTQQDLSGGDPSAMFEVLEDAPLDIDDLAGRSGLDASRAAAALMELALLGHARQWPGNRFSRASV